MNKKYILLAFLGVLGTKPMYSMKPQKPLPEEEIQSQIDSGEIEIEYTTKNEPNIDQKMTKMITIHDFLSNPNNGKVIEKIIKTVEKVGKKEIINQTKTFHVKPKYFDKYDNLTKATKTLLNTFSRINLMIKPGFNQNNLNTTFFELNTKIESIIFSNVNFSNLKINTIQKQFSKLKNLKKLTFKNCKNLKLDKSFVLKNITEFTIYGNEVDVSSFTHIADSLPNLTHLKIYRKSTSIKTFNIKSLPTKLEYLHVSNANFKNVTVKEWRELLKTLSNTKLVRCKKIDPIIKSELEAAQVMANVGL